MAHRDEIVAFLNSYLQIDQFQDYGPNGWQVSGCEEVGRVALGVSANMEFFRQSASWGAQMLIVHHGLIWGELKRIDLTLNRRLKFLYQRDLTLLAYHLPLDAHREIGNNVLLAKRARWEILGHFGQQNIGVLAKDGNRRVAVISGAGHEEFSTAVAQGIDEFVTGEGREPLYYLAQENNVKLTTLGHYASETLGIQALGPLLSREFRVQVRFIDVPNPF